MPERCVGIIGGLGPESTIDYYRRIVDGWRVTSPGSAPTIVIVSIDVDRALALVATDRAALTDYLLAAVDRLAGAGATFGVISANTPHLVFDDLRARTALPLVSMIEETARTAQSLGLRRIGLLGTRFTMQAGFYPEVFGRMGIEVVVPEPDDITYVHDHYIGELLNGVFRDETRAGVVAVAERMRVKHGVDGFVLGGTELPLLLKDDTIFGLPLLDTTAIHVAAILERLRE